MQNKEFPRLRECPFCGSSDVGIAFRLPLFGEVETKFVMYNCCGCMTAQYRNVDKAVEAWNRRANDDFN